MRAVGYTPGYHQLRTIHKVGGIIMYFSMKAKLFFLSRLEDQDGVMNKSGSLRLEIIFIIITSATLLVWIIVYINFEGRASTKPVLKKKHRNKVIEVSVGQFDSHAKSVHYKLMDIRNDIMVRLLLTFRSTATWRVSSPASPGFCTKTAFSTSAT
jgi:cytochrome c oxidase subunit IV